MKFLRFAFAFCFLAIAQLVVFTAPAKADLIYNWTGTVTEWFGLNTPNGWYPVTGTAEATLTLADTYIPGTDIKGSDVLAFNFTTKLDPGFEGENESLNLDLLLWDMEFMGLGTEGGFPTNLTDGKASLVLYNSAHGISFETYEVPFHADGDSPAYDWRIGIQSRDEAVRGSDFYWTAVPEPTSLLLFGTGVIGIGLAAWRRRKA